MSRYSYIGGFDGTSNVAGGRLFGINVAGTHAHSLVTSYTGLADIKNPALKVSTEAHVFKLRIGVPFLQSCCFILLFGCNGCGCLFPSRITVLVHPVVIRPAVAVSRRSRSELHRPLSDVP